MPVTIEGSKGVNGGAAEFKSFTFGVVGDRRNIRATIPDGSTSAVFSGDCHILSDGSGGQVLVSNFSLTLNTSLSGVGGVAQGQSAPASGYLAVWHIFNPSSNTQSVIATDCTGVQVPEVLDQALLPAGYLFSALLTILPTKSDTKLALCSVVGREVNTNTIPVYSTSSIPSGVVVSLLDKYPRNSKKVGVVLTVTSATSQQASFSVGPGSNVQSRLEGAIISGHLATASGMIRGSGRLITSPDHSYVVYAAGSSGLVFSMDTSSYEI